MTWTMANALGRYIFIGRDGDKKINKVKVNLFFFKRKQKTFLWALLPFYILFHNNGSYIWQIYTLTHLVTHGNLTTDLIIFMSFIGFIKIKHLKRLFFS